MSASVTIRRVDARERAGEIKDLFRRNDRAGFDRFYDLEYGAAAAAGGGSWVGEDAAGRVVMHVGLFPRTATDGRTSWRTGLLGDLMADESHRDFFGPARLVRQAVADAAAGREYDFLYSDPTPPSAGVVKAAGFTPFGELRRFMMPTGPLFRAAGALRAGSRALPLRDERALNDPAIGGLLAGIRAGPPVRVRRTLAMVLSRTAGEPLSTGRWLVLGDSGEPSALCLVAADSVPGRGTLVDFFWNPQRAGAAAVLLAAAKWSRRQGYQRLNCMALEGSDVARELVRAGCLPREDTQPIVMKTLGNVAPPPAAAWLLGRLDGSAW